MAIASLGSLVIVRMYRNWKNTLLRSSVDEAYAYQQLLSPSPAPSPSSDFSYYFDLNRTISLLAHET